MGGTNNTTGYRPVQAIVTTDARGQGFAQPPGGQGPGSNKWPLAVVCPNISVSISHPAGAPLNIVDEGNGRFFTQLTAQSVISGTYVWTVSNPAQVQQFDTGVTMQNATGQTVNPEFLTPGVYTMTVTLTAECGSAAASITVGITPKVTVIGYIDKSAVDDAYNGVFDSSAVDPDIIATLGNAVACPFLLKSWAAAGAAGDATKALIPVESDNDRLYANYFAMDGSANPVPPASINPATFKALTNNYRQYNNGQATFELQNQAMVYPVFHTNDTQAGNTPEPCTGLQLFSLAPENGPLNGVNGVTADGQTVYQIMNARVGTDGQDANRYINKRTFGTEVFTSPSPSASTPYTWILLQFNSNGQWIPLTQGTVNDSASIFPTFMIYLNGSLSSTLASVPPETFSTLGSSFQLTAPK